MNKRGRVTQPLLTSAILLGCGMGALFDGILLHQIAQWHNMLSSVRPPTDLAAMKYNMLWDGLFHAAAWLTTGLGIEKLWACGRRSDVIWSNRTFGGGLLLGWGTFNLLEGVLDHHVFQLHHVHPGYAEAAWDWAFLAWGSVMLLAGMLLAKRTVGARGGSSVYTGARH
jgi:uncharacterized membrane protein